ncbi:hypothetical protein KJ652_01690 [Patescibacteria group bacterium]|nr:hypothetical protein [Patescibacteria group bacterium]MBU1123276.1 hypothetical protein [Patescibacteria group bacterium]MBU1910859.1 hypothetical protein [Patescibacteria group bacterium]
MNNNTQEVLVNLMLKHTQDMPMFGDISLSPDKATILLTGMKSFSKEDFYAVYDLMINLINYIVYKKEIFLEPHLYGNIPTFKFSDRKTSRDFAIGYLRTGGLIKVVNNRIQIVSEKELRGFCNLAIINLFGIGILEKNNVDETATERYLRIEPRGIGVRLIEVNRDDETELHNFQSDSVVRDFFDVCWNNAGTIIEFDHFYKVLQLNKRQKFKPSEYIDSMGLQSDDRKFRYAYVNPDEKYVYFQRHYNAKSLRKTVLNEYRNKD